MSEQLAPEHEQVAIVLVGSFNPKIFHPEWFVAQDLIPKKDSEDSDIKVVNNDFCLFETSWFRLEVLNDRWSIASRSTPFYELLRDLALSTFGILGHCPVDKVGLNSSAHFSMPSLETRDRFGHALAPKDKFWEPALTDPRTLTLTVQGSRPDDYSGAVRVRVEPSQMLPTGVFLDVNDEYIRVEEMPKSWVDNILDHEWEKHRNRVEEIQRTILSQAWGLENEH